MFFHRSRLCRAPNSEKVKRTVKNIVMKFYIHIDIDKMYPMRLSNDIWDTCRSRFCRGSNSEKSETGPIP